MNGGGYGTKAAPVEIISSTNEANEDGSFKYRWKNYFKSHSYFEWNLIANLQWNSFESADGIKVEASGSQKKVGPKPEDIGTVSKGSYSYTAPDGTPITVNWVADENGFQPTGNHLPTPPPMPEHVVKMLADIKKTEQQQQQYATGGRNKYY